MNATTVKPELSRRKEPLARVSSESLLGTCRERVIMHNGREYRLRLTRNGRLILTA